MRPTPSIDSPDYCAWEVTENAESLICPGCITSEELQATYDPRYWDYEGESA